MTPWDYLSKYVWVSQQRKQLYKRVFLKYLSKVEEPESELGVMGNDELPEYKYKERTLVWQSLPHALEDVLEFHGTEKNVQGTLSVLEYDPQVAGDLDFRAWCGIVSFAERLALADESGSEDSCDELEKADFNSMEQIMPDFEVPEKLKLIFDIIRKTHKVRY